MASHDCILAIVGSRDVPKYASESIIKTAVLEHGPKMIVSGGAKGVDTHAVEIAAELGILTTEFVPTAFRWDAPTPEAAEPVETILPSGGMRVTIPGGFKQRNEKIAETADCVVRIASRTTKTYGSGWTADEAERLGKSVTRHTV